MLPSQTRYDYSSIESRKDYSWPGGKRLAFYVALNVEHFAFLTGRGMDPTNRGGPPDDTKLCLEGLRQPNRDLAALSHA